MAGITTILNWAIRIGICVIMIHSWWILYDKMGEKGWKCLIPFYGKYLLFERVWEAKIYFISLGLNTATTLLGGYAVTTVLNAILTGAMGGDAILSGKAGLFIFVVLFYCLSLAMQMMLNWRMTKCFGRGIGTFLGITFLPIIFLPILAYGSSYYDYY